MSIGAQILAHCAPKISGEEPLAQPLRIVVFDATAANPIVADHFVRRIANVEYIAATIARRIVAVHWIKVSHAEISNFVSLNRMVISPPAKILSL
jgi:hypothetical protein